MKNSFYDYRKRFLLTDIKSYLSSVTREKIENVLLKPELDVMDFLALLSDAADDCLETIAQKASMLTRMHFGNSVFIFTPLYISDYCVNACPYCSFSVHQKIDRTHLTIEEIEEAAKRISNKGIRHILMLTGEAPKKAGLDYLPESIAVLRKYFSSISIEIYPQKENEYSELLKRGAESLTIYQEVYDEAAYAGYHKNGPKADYRFRLEAPDRGLLSGMRAITIGALFGLNDIVSEAFSMALHLHYLEENYPSVELSVSLPRIRPVVSGFVPPFMVSDRLFVRIMLAFRIFKPRVGITISTRESKEFRNAILPMGVTKMSAGVSTSVGGKAEVGQFEIADVRSVDDVCSDLLKQGYQPVMHDWSHKFAFTAGQSVCS